MIKLLYFTSPTCTRCRMIKQEIENLKECFKNEARVEFNEYDISSTDGLAEASFHLVTETPTLLLVSDDFTSTWKYALLKKSENIIAVVECLIK